MKTLSKFLILLTLAAMLFVPFQAARASGLFDGGQVLFGSSYVVREGETLNGDLVIFGGSANVEQGGKVNGALILFGGSVNVSGEITGDVVVVGGSLNLTETSHVYGSAVTIGGSVQRAVGARVDGDLIENATGPVNVSPDRPAVPDVPNVPGVPEINVNVNPLWELVSLIGRAFALSMLALLIVLFLPEQTRRVGEAAAGQPLMVGGLGLLTVFVGPLALLAMVVTILLIPVAGLALILFGVAMVFGWLGLGLEIGLRFARMVPSAASIPMPMAAAIGTFLLTIVANGVGWLPCVGWLAPFLLSMLGLGAVLMTRFGSRPAALTATTPAVEPAPVDAP